MDDTIVALSTPAGGAARGVVRLAGGGAIAVARALSPRASLRAATAERVTLGLDLGPVPATVYAFRAPRSYTGDDVVELHLPSNPVLIDSLLRQCVRLGARPAGPGEFTARAFLRGRLGLAEAEGVALSIAAVNAAELDAARRLLAGELTQRLHAPTEALTALLAAIEAGIDFSDEGVTFVASSELRTRLAGARSELQSLRDHAPRIEGLAAPRVVLVGRPNAGKSTLLNALVGNERAVASPVAGTTRDALTADADVPGGTVTLVDLAGLDTAIDPDVSTEIQQQMQALLHAEIDRAAVVVLVQDVTDSRPAPHLARPADLTVFTKCDLSPVTPGPTDDVALVSAATGRGLDVLRQQIGHAAFQRHSGEGLALGSRHIGELASAVAALQSAESAIDGDRAELIAADVRDALDALGRIVGHVSPDDVLDRVFGAFCIGK
ncbi:MAG TPA: GTPase [Tepidisphaeraceae bacterium]